jgi:hypothetical protein
MKRSQIFAAALAIAALGASSSAGQANVKYTVENATFDDGTFLTGYFVLNQYDQLVTWDLTTVTGALPGFEYTPGTTFLNGGCGTSPCFEFSRAPTYLGTLQLAFINPLPSFGTDPFDHANSWETFSFGFPGLPVRFLESGDVIASTPEPATWAMMVIGFAGLGFAGYRKARTGRLA